MIGIDFQYAKVHKLFTMLTLVECSDPHRSVSASCTSHKQKQQNYNCYCYTFNYLCLACCPTISIAIPIKYSTLMLCWQKDLPRVGGVKKANFFFSPDNPRLGPRRSRSGDSFDRSSLHSWWDKCAHQQQEAAATAAAHKVMIFL